MLTIPDRSLKQRMDALERANHVRVKRAQLKRDLKAGRVDVMGLIEDPPEWADTMRVYDVLTSLPWTGPRRAHLMLRLAGASPRKTLGGLSDRQRDELLWLLFERRERARRDGRLAA